MTPYRPQTVQLGELVTAVYDSAAAHGGDPREVSRLAGLTVRHMLRGSHWPDRPRSLPTGRDVALN
jgi:hypothetical protein